MKIKNLNKHKTKLLKLKLLETKIYKNKKELNYTLLKDVETRLKKILHIIYKFHIANKKILFIGAPIHLSKQIKQLLKTKRHSFIPEQIWLNGIITNSSSSFKYLLKRHAINNDKTSNFLFNLKNQIDLIVLLDEKVNLPTLKENLLKRIPTISLNSNYNLPNNELVTYKVTGDYKFGKKKIRNNFFFLLLSSLLKKAETLRKRQLQTFNRPKKAKRKKKFN